MTEDEVGTLRASSVAMRMAIGALDVLGHSDTLTATALKHQVGELNRLTNLLEAEARQQPEPDTKRSNTSQELADTQQELRSMEETLVTCKRDLDALRNIIVDRDTLIRAQSRSITELKQLLEAHQDARPVSPDDPIIASQQPQDAMDITPLLSPDTLASVQKAQELPDTGVTWVRKSTGHQYRIMGFAKVDGCSVEHPLFDTQRVEVLPGCDGHAYVIRPHVKDEAGTRKVLKAIVQTATPYTGEKPTTWVLYSDRVGGDWYARPLLEFCDRFQALHKV